MKINCPHCQETLILEQDRYYCNKCGFFIPCRIEDKELSIESIKELFKHGFSKSEISLKNNLKGRLLLLPTKAVLLTHDQERKSCEKCNSTLVYDNENITWCSNCHWCQKKHEPNDDLKLEGYYPTKMHSNEELYDLFISHSSHDNAKALEIYKFLTKNGYKCWLDSQSINPAVVYSEEIAEGLLKSKIFIAIFSSHANQSRPILDEVITAYNEQKPIIVYNIDPKINVRNIKSGFKLPFGSPQWISDHNIYQHPQALEQLLLSIHRIKRELRDQSPDHIKHSAKSKLNNFAFMLLRSIITAVLFFSISLLSYHLYFNYAPNDLDQHESSNVLNNLALENSKITNKIDTKNFEIGTILRFGSYWAKPIYWIYAFDDEEGNQVFISKDLITFKPFDVAHSNLYGRIANGFVVDVHPNRSDLATDYINRLSSDDWIRAFGENYWETSTLRAWLNSDQIMVKYPYVTPSLENTNSQADASQAYGSAYVDQLNEPGFLTGFTPDEIELLQRNNTSFILTSRHVHGTLREKTVFNYFAHLDPQKAIYRDLLKPKIRPFIFDFKNVATKTVSDLVYIPSLEEFIKISQDRRIDLDYSKEIFLSNGDTYRLPKSQWWLNTPCGFLNTTICTAEGSDLNKGKAILRIATVSNFNGVRPLIKLQIKQLKLKGLGTMAKPYYIPTK